jgi:AraC-like DNA-binding protein/mannose-6-phosphate isomerase-like protein (cupin superfamily)
MNYLRRSRKEAKDDKMKTTLINRIDYKNIKKNLDFEIVDLQLFFATIPHKHLKRDYRLNFWSIIYVTSGSGYHYVDFQAYPYKKGDIIFIQKNQVHHYEINNEVKGYILNINEPFFYRIEGFKGDIFLEFVDKAFGSPVLSFDVSLDRPNRILIDLIYKEYNKIKENISVELIATLFQGFILALKSQLPSNEKMLLSKDYENFKVYRQLVEENYSTIKNVEEYASIMNLSKKTINQATRKVVGLSAKQVITNRIVLEIKRYLSQGELMNYEIADLLGFDEAANMTKFFKHYVGISPKEFKESIK